MEILTKVFSEQKLAHIEEAMANVIKLGNKFEHIESQIHNFAPLSEIDRIEKDIVKNYATKQLVEFIRDDIGDFAKKEDIEMLKGDNKNQLKIIN